jgi:hypothetical protein
MFLMAPETKGYTLEEMDEVFDSGLPAWRKLNKRSRLEELEQEIAEGKLKVAAHGEKDGPVAATTVTAEKQMETV